MKVVSLETHIVAVPPPHVGGMYGNDMRFERDDFHLRNLFPVEHVS